MHAAFIIPYLEYKYNESYLTKSLLLAFFLFRKAAYSEK